MELTEYMKANALLKKYNIKNIESKYVETAEEAISFSKGKPIVMKVLSSKALHKSKNKLVELNLSSKEEIRNAFNGLKKGRRNSGPIR